MKSLPFLKKILFSATALFIFLLCLECAIRIVSYFAFGRSPFFLHYGLGKSSFISRRDPNFVHYNGYVKFAPSKKIMQYRYFDSPTPIQINACGFRGKDFSARKPPGTYRIICMGESSTFGYFSRDDHTYPFLLERTLKKQLSGTGVEVINAGIPNMASGHMRAMFESELVYYDPDLVTLYCGFNNADFRIESGLAGKALSWFYSHSAIYAAVKVASLSLGQIRLPTARMLHRNKATRAYIQRQIELHKSVFYKDINEIVAIARRHNQKVILIKQALDPFWWQGGPGYKKISYREMLLQARQELKERGFVSQPQALLLVHGALMDALEHIATEHRLTIVDNIAQVDAHPEYLASYVHLTEEGNRALADILAHACAKLLTTPAAYTRQ